MDELLSLGAFELAQNIARKKITPLEAVEAHIGRIEAVNPKLNAVVAERFAAARAEAVEAGEALARGDKLGPLHGVPCSIKETFAFKGLPHTGGSWHRKGHIADEDATAVKRLRAAGAIPLGITNVPELAMWSETYNTIYGRTRNPFGLDRTCGGSSGGEAAIVGAGGAPFGLGSDIGGSIRMPAFFCGVFGHKPSGGAIPLTGHFPRAVGPSGRYCVAGPIARRARDLMPLMQILAGPDGLDVMTREVDLRPSEGVDFKDRRVLVLEDMKAALTVGPNHEMRIAVRRAALAFESKGAIVEPWWSPKLAEAVSIWSSMIAEDSVSFSDMLGGGQPPNYPVEFLRSVGGRSRYTFPALIFGAAEKIFLALGDKVARRFIDLGRALRGELEAALADGAILISPTHPRPAPKHDTPLLRPFDFIYTGIFNVLEVPVTAIPMGLGPDLIPLGVQIAAARGNDHLTIAAAEQLEAAVGGWSIPVRSLW